MANRRVVLECTGQKTAVVDPPTSTPARQANKKRQHQQPNANKNQQPTTNKRQRKQGVTSRSGAKSRPDPENVIVIDSADEEEPEAELAAKQPTSRPETTAKSREPSASRASMESLDSDDYFEVLGLSRSATDADIKKAYRKLAIQWHPDKNRENPQAEEYFKRIAEAYEVLSDPEKRRQYERYGKQGASGSGPSSSDGFADAHYSGFSSRHARDIFEAFFGGGDPFEAFFSASGPRAGRSGRHRSRHAMMDPFGDDNDFGFGGMPSMMSMMGGFGGGFGRSPFDDPFFSGHGAFGGGGGSFSSQSVSSSSYTDRNGHVVTTKTTTTTTTTPEGRTETVTEEYRNGKLTHSSSSSNGTSRLAGAGRLHLEGGTRTNSSSRRGRRQ